MKSTMATKGGEYFCRMLQSASAPSATKARHGAAIIPRPHILEILIGEDVHAAAVGHDHGQPGNVGGGAAATRAGQGRGTRGRNRAGISPAPTLQSTRIAACP